jgi:hypothetical protein
MISPQVMRGKGIGAADRPSGACGASPSRAMDMLASYAVMRFGKAHGSLWTRWVRQEERRHVSALELQALAYARGSDAPAGSLLGAGGAPAGRAAPSASLQLFGQKLRDAINRIRAGLVV